MFHHAVTPEERFASVIRAGTGYLRIADTRFPVALAALHEGELVLGVNTGLGHATIASSHAWIELRDELGPGELGPRGAAYATPCAEMAEGSSGSDGGVVIRYSATVRGAVSFMDAEQEREVALQLAAQTPNPALLAVGVGVRLVQVYPDSIVLVDATGAELVDPADLVIAEPDPFCDVEFVWLARLNHSEANLVAAMVEQIVREPRPGYAALAAELAAVPGPIIATALDRFGVTLGARDAGGVRRQWRLGFRGDCVTIHDIATEIGALCGQVPGGSLLRDRRRAEG